jgi:3-isopropylmalate/(R)-2-methylmalate dehydratase small subunit
MNVLIGKAFKFGDDISTDHITPGRFFHLRGDITKLAEHTLEDADPEFAGKVQPGDFVVGGRNFGLGSSREHAPRVIAECKVSAVLAKSFARIFYRNAINVGLPVLECDTSGIDAGDELEVDLASGIVKNVTKGTEIKFTPIPEFMRGLLADGGLAQHIKKHNGFKI